MQTFLHTPLTVVIAGAGGAIGGAVLKQLLAQPNVKRVYLLHRTPQLAATLAMPSSEPLVGTERVTTLRCDITQNDELQALTHRLRDDQVSINLLFNATGLLHGDNDSGDNNASGGIRPEKALSQLTQNALQASFAINAFAPILLLQAVLPAMNKTIPAWVVNLSARVGSIEDNRLGGWYSYRSAKAAQNQLLKTASIELKRSHPQLTCLQLHPGTVDSALSKPFQSGVTQGKLFTAAQSAAYLLDVIARKTPADTGTFWDWNDTAIPW
jgi:NAD(P)-dependent dehydrogenase (short-subunit alcohol dehydrogenase family)